MNAQNTLQYLGPASLSLLSFFIERSLTSQVLLVIDSFKKTTNDLTSSTMN